MKQTEEYLNYSLLQLVI